MSYRLIDSNAIAIKYPEVNEMPCVFANLPDGMNGQFIDAQPEQRWIPCSERLPEIGEHYVSEMCIVYCSNGAYGFAQLEENIFGQIGWDCERDDEYHESLGEVLAWMPIPEPYRRGKE